MAKKVIFSMDGTLCKTPSMDCDVDNFDSCPVFGAIKSWNRKYTISQENSVQKISMNRFPRTDFNVFAVDIMQNLCDRCKTKSR